MYKVSAQCIIIIIIIIILETSDCLNVDLKLRNSPFARSATVGHAIDSDTDIFTGSSISIKDLLVIGTFIVKNEF